jgi:hypothetical protein
MFIYGEHCHTFEESVITYLRGLQAEHVYSNMVWK